MTSRAKFSFGLPLRLEAASRYTTMAGSLEAACSSVAKLPSAFSRSNTFC